MIEEVQYLACLLDCRACLFSARLTKRDDIGQLRVLEHAIRHPEEGNDRGPIYPCRSRHSSAFLCMSRLSARGGFRSNSSLIVEVIPHEPYV